MSQPCEQGRRRSLLWYLVGPAVVLLLAIALAWPLPGEDREIAERERTAKAEYDELEEIIAEVEAFLADKEVLLGQVGTIRAFHSRRMEVSRIMAAVLQAQARGESALETLTMSDHRCEISLVAPSEEDAARFADVLRSVLELPDVELTSRPGDDVTKAHDIFDLRFDLGTDKP